MRILLGMGWGKFCVGRDKGGGSCMCCVFALLAVFFAK